MKKKVKKAIEGMVDEPVMVFYKPIAPTPENNNAQWVADILKEVSSTGIKLREHYWIEWSWIQTFSGGNKRFTKKDFQ